MRTCWPVHIHVLPYDQVILGGFVPKVILTIFVRQTICTWKVKWIGKYAVPL